MRFDHPGESALHVATTRRLVLTAVAAMAAPLVLAPTAHAAQKDYTTEVEASFTDDGVRYTIDAEGDDDSGARGTWTMRERDGDRARGRVVCVAGSRLGGGAAAIVVDITSSTVRGLRTSDYVLHYLWDAKGRDKHRWREIDGPGRREHRSCPEDGFDLRNLDNVRGDIEVHIENSY